MSTPTAPPTAIGLDAFNDAPEQEALEALLACCPSRRWARTLARHRPYPSGEDLYAAADRALADLEETDVDEALTGHPRIGDRPSATTTQWSRQEQSGVSDGTREGLADGNRAYEARFGQVYLVCATGRSGEEMLTMLHERLENPPEVERAVLREELRKINRIRLEKLLVP